MLLNKINSKKIGFIKAVYYFGGACPLSVWDNFSSADCDLYLSKIKRDGFNTVVVIVPAGLTWTKKHNSKFYRTFLKNLAVLQAKCKEHGLFYIYRLFFIWDSFPFKLNRLRQTYQVFTDQYDDYEKLASDIFEISKNDPQFLFGFITWEDMIPQLIVTMPNQSASKRLEVGKEINIGVRFENGALPEIDSPDYPAYLTYIDERFVEVVRKLRNVFPLLTAEVRVDYSPIPAGDGHFGVHIHEQMYKMPNGVDVVGTYYATYMGAKNERDEITAKFAFDNFKLSQRHVMEMSSAKIFVDQLLLYIGQECFAHFSKLPPREIRDFLFQYFRPWMKKHGVGYANWSFQDYILAANSNASFQLDVDGWELSGDVRCDSPGQLTANQGGLILQTGLTRAVKKSIVVLHILHASQARIEIDLGGGNVFKKDIPEIGGRMIFREYYRCPAQKISVCVERGSVTFEKILLGWDQHSNGGYGLDFEPGVMTSILADFNEISSQ